jgi:hypothetical protein
MNYEPYVDADGEPFVVIRWGTRRGQLSLEATRQLACDLFEVAEQANSDAAAFRYLLETGAAKGEAAAFVQSLDAYRSGDRGMVAQTG